MTWLSNYIQLPITDPTWIFFLVLIIILFAPLLLQRIHVPHVIGLILAGVIVGPYGLNILERDSSFELFGKVGIYYIMFLAGLEMDMGNFARHSRLGAVFGLLTFAIPFLTGWVVGVYVLHYTTLTSLLLSCIFSSHTLVSYPIVSRLGVEKHISVVLSIIATVVATFLSLLILAGVVGSAQTDGNWFFWPAFFTKLFCWLAFVVLVIPYVGRAFLRHFNDRVMQYIFILATVFLCAATAELAGLEGLLGAFLAGLVLNRLIPKVSPLMTRIEFIGNALFIPYFLIGVGMIINVRILFQDPKILWVIGVMLLTATCTKWIAAVAMQKLYRMKWHSRLMMFGLTDAHAAGALAIVMIGRRIELSPGVFLMDDTVLNGTVMIILLSCIISSLATERAGRHIAISNTSLDDNRGRHHGKCMVALGNPLTVDNLTQLSLMIRNPKMADGLIGISAVYEDENSEKRLAAGRQNLEKAVKIAASADVKLTPISRISTNITSGIVHAMAEYDVGEVIIGIHHRMNISDSFIGKINENLIHSTHQEIILVRCIIPPSTFRRIDIVVPPKAEYEVGFYKWLEHVCRMGDILGCRMHFYTNDETYAHIRRYINKLHRNLRTEYNNFDNWDDLLLLSNKVEYENLLVFVTARRGFISYDPQFDRLPMQISKYFANTSVMIIYPDQNGDSLEKVTLFNSVPHP